MYIHAHIHRYMYILRKKIIRLETLHWFVLSHALRRQSTTQGDIQRKWILNPIKYTS
jgi:hypothetical protein